MGLAGEIPNAVFWANIY